MKFIKSITLASFLFASIISVNANNQKQINPKTNLKNKIEKLIGNQIPVKVGKSFMDAKISFIINDNNEVVVVSVSAKDKKVDSYIKHRLNYQKVNVAGAKKGEIYILPLKIKQA